MNIEEIATIYHLPNITVITAPYMKRVESRRMRPPAGLPIFSETSEKPGGFQFGTPKKENLQHKEKSSGQ